MYTSVCMLSRVRLHDPMDSSLPGSFVHEILQARILEWVAVPSSRESSWPKDRTHIAYVSLTAGRFFTAELLGKPRLYLYVDMNKEKVMERYTPGFIREIVVEGCGQKLNTIQYIYAMY